MAILRSSDDLKFLDILDFQKIDIKDNLFTFITGKSGSGKSTYLKLLNRTALPSAGEIFYKDKNIKEYPVLEYRKEVIMIPQEVFLIEGTIYDNFKFFYEAREDEVISKDEINKFLELSYLDYDADKKVDNLSGGERQRVFVSIFLSFKSPVLLLDEPTAALDEKTSNKLLSNLKKYFKENNVTAICVCHNDVLVEKFSDYTIRLGAEK